MAKISFDTWATDMKILAVKARRFAYANRCLTYSEAEKACDEFNAESLVLQGKYGIPAEKLKGMAKGIADACELGLAY